jgi:site-specific recombinase XerD
MYVHDPSRVRVGGPLAPYAAGFRAELVRSGYRPSSTSEQLWLMAHLSRWLAGEGLDPAGLTGQVFARFMLVRRATRRRLVGARAGLALLSYLRGLGVVPGPADAVVTPQQQLLDAYRGYLVSERGLVEGSVRLHMPIAAAFVAALADPVGEALRDLSVGQVVTFVNAQTRCRSVGYARRVASVTRSLLRFLLAHGRVGRDLRPAVLPVAGWRLSGLPGRMDPQQVTAIVDGCDRGTPAGRREYAILLMLARLGLRACEVATLSLDDVDWRAGELTIAGKGGRSDRLPLPCDVGEALAGYLHDGRPGCSVRTLVVSLRAPLRAITASGVRSVVHRACARVGLAPVGAHRLRHTLASELLAAGASLPEIGQVLRHTNIATTTIYAKVDRVALACLARPWPLPVTGDAA